MAVSFFILRQMIGMMGIALLEPILRESEICRCRGAIYCARRYTGAFGGRDESRPYASNHERQEQLRWAG